eukprot:COSAG01_NODE_745_length_13872_cov_40.816525_5_plen_67_part_00
MFFMGVHTPSASRFQPTSGARHGGTQTDTAETRTAQQAGMQQGGGYAAGSRAQRYHYHRCEGLTYM